MSKLIIGGKEFGSRLFVGTGKFRSNELMEKAILASGTEMVTVAMKRVDMDNAEDDMLRHIIHDGIQVLPNTSGVRDAKEAVFAAQLAREAFGTDFIKLEIHPDPKYLLPDPVESGNPKCHGSGELTLLDFLEAADGRAESLAEKKFALAGGGTLTCPILTSGGYGADIYCQGTKVSAILLPPREGA